MNDKPEKKAPTNNGIPELDDICERYNNGEINISQLVCSIWNQGVYVGENIDDE